MIVPKLRFSEFKDDWYEVRIGDITECIVPGRNKPKKFNGDIPWVTIPDLKDKVFVSKSSSNLQISEAEAKNIGSKIVPENSILMSCVGDLGIFSINKVPLVINQQLHAFLLDHSKYSEYFLMYALQTKSKYISSIATKTALPYLNKDNCNSIPIRITSYNEQTKIAEFLSAVDDKISQLSRQLELLNQYKKGVMQKIFSQEIRFKNDNGEDFAEWDEKTLLEIANFRRGSFPQPYGLPQWLDKNGEPFVQVYDVDDNMSLKETTKIKISKLAQEQSVFAPKGTLIITIQGSIGRIAKMQYDAYVDRTLLIFQEYKCPINIDFFKYSLYLLFNLEKERADGGVIKTITKETLSKFVISVPELQEQEKIAEFLGAIDKRINHTTDELTQTKTWKKGLLQQMFV